MLEHSHSDITNKRQRNADKVEIDKNVANSSSPWKSNDPSRSGKKRLSIFVKARASKFVVFCDNGFASLLIIEGKLYSFSFAISYGISSTSLSYRLFSRLISRQSIKFTLTGHVDVRACSISVHFFSFFKLKVSTGSTAVLNAFSFGEKVLANLGAAEGCPSLVKERRTLVI